MNEESVRLIKGKPNYKKLLVRYESFKSHENLFHVSIYAIAHAGFFYSSTTDTDHVRCPWCQVGFFHWKAGVIPLVEHLKNSPQCIFMQKKIISFLQKIVPTKEELLQDIETTEYIDKLDVPDLVKYINNYEDKIFEVKCKVCHARELTKLFLPC